MNEVKNVYLPKMVAKKELAAYCGLETTKALYTSVITEEIVTKSGYTMEEIRNASCKNLPLRLTALIYETHDIKSLR